MKLLSDDELERSAIVANCRMNRERDLTGSNGYSREIGFDPLDFLWARVALDRRVAWLDLCCGTGKALIQAARTSQADGMPIEIVGVDLVGQFDRLDPELAHLRLVEASLAKWHAGRHFDLITCVHGLHYVGDKLGLIARAASWLTDDGLFVATLDLQNFKLANGQAAGRPVAAGLRQAGIEYDRRKRRLTCRSRKELSLPLRYLGADDQAGPNYTGQPAVDAIYQPMSRDEVSGESFST